MDAESMLNAATLLGLPPAGDFQLSARITVDGCTVTFDDVRFTRQRLADLRDGS